MVQTSPIKKRVSVYVDGFNLYHSALQYSYPECRWLNLLELSKRLINPKTEEIQAVYYFSAITTWNPNRAKKHLLYIHALRTVGVKDILGKFTLRDRKCPKCLALYQSHEEKKTIIEQSPLPKTGCRKNQARSLKEQWTWFQSFQPAFPEPFR